jgi:hypothetical protein
MELELTMAEMYALFSGSCLLTSFTKVQARPAAVPIKAVRSRERIQVSVVHAAIV